MNNCWMMVTVTHDQYIFILRDNAFGHAITFTLLNLLSNLGENYTSNHYSFASERTEG